MGKKSAYVKAILAFFIWSLLGPVLNLSSFTAFQNIFLQGVIAVVIMFIILLKTKQVKTLVHLDINKPLIVFTITAGCTGVMFLYSLTLIPIAQVLFLFSSIPLIALAIEIFVFKQKAQLIHYVAIGLGLLGIVIMLSQDFLAKGFGILSLGSFLVLSAALTANIRDFSIKKIGNKYSLEIIIFIIVLSQTILSAFFVISTQWHVTLPSLIGTFFLGTVSSILAFYFYISSVRVIKVSTIATLGYIQPVFGSLWGVLFLAQALSFTTIAGGAVILLAAYFAVKSGE